MYVIQWNEKVEENSFHCVIYFSYIYIIYVYIYKIYVTQWNEKVEVKFISLYNIYFMYVIQWNAFYFNFFTYEISYNIYKIYVIQ